MNAIRRGALALGLLIACQAADAFAPKTHLWIGNQILDELRNECRITLASRIYQIAPDLCQAITTSPESFYAGTLGPDIYPDLVAGQYTTHSGVKDGWDTSEFLEHVVSSASTPSSKAYAAGYLVHAASDVFGHSYVNTYAGDAWNLSGERTVELRHCLIEKYIDAHLPPFPSGATSFQAPADFVRDTLVHNSRMQAQYQRAAKHLASMTSVKATVDDLAARADRLSAVVPDALAKSLESGITLTAQLLDGEAALAVVSAALEVRKAGAASQRDILDRESKEVADAAAAVREHESKLTELATRAHGQQQVAAAANSAARQAITAANEVRTLLSGLANQLRSVPPKIIENVCHNVTEQLCNTLCPEGSSNPLCAVCDVPREVCTAVERINDEHESLTHQIASAKERLGDLESTAAEETAKADAATANANALLQQWATELAALPGIATAKSAAEAAYRAAGEQYRSMASSVANMQQRVDELRRRTEAARKELVDSKAVADQLRSLATQLNLLAHALHGWQRGIDHAGNAFVRVSDRIGHGMLDGRRHLFFEYRRWLACEGAVYMAAPYHVADVACAAESEAQRLPVLMRDMANAALPAPLKHIYDQLDDLRVRIDTELKAAVARATTELVGFVSDQATADFVDLLLIPQHATRAKLNEVLATVGDAGGKGILVFDNGADLIDLDIGLRGDTLDPYAFAALSSAVTLAKLSLLEQTEMRKLVLEIGGSEAQTTYDAGRFDVGRSILITAVRSLDGNHQWQPYGLLYPRSSGKGSPADASDRHYGFGPRDASRHGLPLFIDPVLRERVFLKLFPRQIHGEIAKRPEMAPGRYAFPICDGNPFPVTFLPSGEPALVDDGCSAQPTVSGAH